MCAHGLPQVAGVPLARNQTAVLRALLNPFHTTVHSLFGGGASAGGSRLVDGLVHGGSDGDARERAVSGGLYSARRGMRPPLCLAQCQMMSCL